MKKTFILALATLGLLAVPVASFAGGGAVGPGAWTSCCSAGATIDELSRNAYAVDGCSLFHRGAQTQDVIARYNVTNTEIPDTPFPTWTLMELGFFDPGAMSFVTATLFEVDPCTGERHPICGPVTSFDSAIPDCVRCQIFELPIDFILHLYYVEVVVHRDVNTVVPMANTLRIFSP